jgi:hypothetical protein
MCTQKLDVMYYEDDTATWKYLESLVEQTPDIYGRELQHALFVAYNIDVDVSTITRALHRRGFTRKKVGFFSFY